VAVGDGGLAPGQVADGHRGELAAPVADDRDRTGERAVGKRSTEHRSNGIVKGRRNACRRRLRLQAGNRFRPAPCIDARDSTHCYTE
jgi:hypothetical protein